jgi:hypothetical protein
MGQSFKTYACQALHEKFNYLKGHDKGKKMSTSVPMFMFYVLLLNLPKNLITTTKPEP